MKNLFYLLISLFLVLGCRKENGKMPYDFALYFESGDEWHFEWKIYEKYRKDDYDDDDLKYTIGIKTGDGIYLGPHKALYKTESKKLMGTFFLKNNDGTILSGQSGSYEGYLTVEGSYDKHFREFIVEDGMFEFLWTNAEVYGMNDTVLKGKWTMKRK